MDQKRTLLFSFLFLILIGTAACKKAMEVEKEWIRNGPDGGSISTLVIDPVTASTLYIGTCNGGIFKSTDGGDNWEATKLVADKISAIAIDPMNPNIIYASDSLIVFKSEDAGASWFGINNGFDTLGINALAVDPVSTDTIYIGGGLFTVEYIDGNTTGIKEGSIMKSINGGETWSVIGEELNFAGVNTLIIDPTETDTLFVGTYAGVFKSTDGGKSWFKIEKGPTHPEVSALAIDPNNGRIYAGTAGSGVFRYDLER